MYVDCLSMSRGAGDVEGVMLPARGRGVAGLSLDTWNVSTMLQ